VAANAKFCPKCGRPLGGDRPPDLRGNVWRKSPDEFAARVEASDLRGGLYKELEVQPGQQVVVLVDGRAEEGRIGPGRYTMDSFFERLLTLGAGRHVTALLLDGGFVTMEFQLPKLYTRDDYEVSGRCVVGVQTASPVSFFVNMMKSERSVTTGDLRNFLFDEVRDAVQEVVGGYDFRGLATGLALKDQMASAVEQHLNETLATSGLRFGGVRTVEVHHPRLEALRRQWEEIRIAREQVEADRTQTGEQRRTALRSRQEAWEAQLASETQETAEQRDQARIFEERAQVWEETRRALLSEEMNQVRTKEDFQDFLAQINERQLLRQEQLDVLAEDFASRTADRATARAHAAYLAELERDYNRKQAELVWKTDFTLEQMAAGLRVEQQKLADEGLLDGKRWDNDMAGLVRGAERAEWDRAEARKQTLFDRGHEKDAQAHRQDLEKAQTLHRLELRAIETDADLTDAQKRKRTEVELQRYEAERRGIQRQIEAADFDERRRQTQAEDEDDMKLAADAVDLLAKMKQNKLSVEETARRIAREDELTRAAAAHQQELDRIAQARLTEAQKQAHELALLKARADISAEALISLSGPEQAKVIADLKRTETMKGMTDEQVLYMVAERSPQVAQALTERFKALQEQPKVAEAQLTEVRTLYDRMLADIQQNREKDAELHTRTEDRFQQMFTQALDSQRTGMVDIARATGGPAPAASGPVIVMNPATGQPQVIQTTGGVPQVSGAPAGEVQICPRCRVKSPVGEKYCSNCGFNFYQA
jgi:hypothetical protein